MTDVIHHTAEHRFEFASGESLAVCEYQPQAGLWTFTHTYVPDALRGRGMAGLLVKTALDEARKQGVRIVPQCSYVKVFIDHHPEYGDLVASQAQSNPKRGAG